MPRRSRRIAAQRWTSINEPALTLTLCVAASNAKWQAGEVVEALRLAQRAIDLAEGDPTRDGVVIGSPLTLALALRGANRLALGIDGWRDDLDRAAEMAISIDVTSHVAGILLKHSYAVNNAALSAGRDGGGGDRRSAAACRAVRR